MEDKCQTFSKYLMPLFRSMVAKELVVTHGLNQNQASKLLGTTQAAVSQYINAKRANKGCEKFSYLLPKMQNIAKHTATQLSNKQVTWIEVTAGFCNMCSNMIDEETNKETDNYII